MKNKLIKVIKNPLWILVFLNNRGIHILNDKEYLKLRYKLVFNKKLDLINPRTFNEKLQYLKLYDRKDLYTKLVDKYEVKDYVAKLIGKEYVIPTYGVYNKFEEIDFDKLPNKFVIKTTHYGGNNGVFIVKDKNSLNTKNIKKVINRILKQNLYYSGREWPYKDVKPRIIIEKYLEDKNGDLNDFKIQTFNGKIGFSFVCTNRSSGNVRFTFYDRNKNFIPVTQSGALFDQKNGRLPKNYDKLVELSEKLAKGIPEVRIDFYDVDGKIYFGEYTFFDSSGFGKFNPEEMDYKFGSMLDLSSIMRNSREKKNEK